MPFTPYHFGPALLLGAALWRWLHWPTLIVASLVVDIEPLFALMLLGGYPLHGYLHTFLASAVGGFFVGVFMYFIDRPLKWVYHGLVLVERSLGLKSYLVAGVIGWSVHVLYDAPLYYEMLPLYPLQGNPFYESLSHPALHAFYVVLLCAGATVYLVNTFKVSYDRNGANYALMQVGLLSVVVASLFLSTFDVPMIFSATAIIIGGIIVFYTSLSKLAKQWRTRIMLSMLFMLIAIITLLAITILSLPSLKANFEVLLDTLIHLPTVLLAILWVSVLAGLLLLKRPLNESSSIAMSRLTLMLILGWILAPVILGIPVSWIALVLMAARIGEVKHAQQRAI